MTKLQAKLVAVDLDGTLVDSAPDIAHCLGTALEAVGFVAPGEARTRLWIGDGLESLIARAISHATHGDVTRGAELHPRALAAFLECYERNLFVRSRLYPNAAATLDALLARGIRLCCITNKRYSFAEPLLQEAGVLNRFELLLGGDSLAEKKPSPLPLTTAAKQLGVAPREAALVGDSHQDLRAAKAAGYSFVLATYGYGRVDETEAATALRLKQFADLDSLFA